MGSISSVKIHELLTEVLAASCCPLLANIQAFVKGIAATSYIPIWGGGWPTTTYQGHPAYEGFYALPMPCPPGASVCVRISSRFAGSLTPPMPAWQQLLLKLTELQHGTKPPVPQAGDLSPGMFTWCKYTPWELGHKLALTPGTIEDLDYLNALGVADATAWARAVGLDKGTEDKPEALVGMQQALGSEMSQQQEEQQLQVQQEEQQCSLGQGSACPAM